MPNAKIYYHTLQDETRRQDKLDWLRYNPLSSIEFEQIIPDNKGNWLYQTDNDFETLLPLASKEVKANKEGELFDQAVFKLFSLGVVTARDEWVYDFDKHDLEKKVRFLIDIYNQDVERLKGKNKDEIRDEVDTTIKWTRAVKNDLLKGEKYNFDKSYIIDGLYRPFVKKKLYFNEELNEMQYQLNSIFGKQNFLICINQSSAKDFNIIATNILPDYHLNGDANCLPFYRYDKLGNRIENITDWGLEQFRERYITNPPKGFKPLGGLKEELKKEDIFHYVYAVLHNPAYRKKYEINLKREFPRIPFYENFEQWANWGKALMALHIGYENVCPFGLEVLHRTWAGSNIISSEQKGIFNEAKEIEPLYKTTVIPKPKLKADKLAGIIELDEKTLLKGVPPEAWEYKLGNRSALEWVLDQYKESKPSDPTIAEKFNTYRFANYKEQVIDLLQKVCTVSVETMKIVRDMDALC
jgi:predicted helicase